MSVGTSLLQRKKPQRSGELPIPSRSSISAKQSAALKLATGQGLAEYSPPKDMLEILRQRDLERLLNERICSLIRGRHFHLLAPGKELVNEQGIVRGTPWTVEELILLPRMGSKGQKTARELFQQFQTARKLSPA